MGNVAHAIGNVANAISNVIGWISSAIGWFGRLASAANSALGGIPGKILGAVGGLFGFETGGIAGAASGGVQGGLRMVGEHGPELVRLPRGSMVYPNSNVSGMMGGGGGGDGSSTLYFDRSGSSGLERVLEDWFIKRVRVKGGGNVQKAFGSTGR
jgi:hypothetical protein